MKRILHLFLYLFIAFAMNAQDKTESPYFIVETAGDGFRLLRTGADVEIAGMIANVEVQQLYVNSGTTVVAATYLFPMSTRAAVHGLTFRIGNQRVNAVVQSKQKATAIYNEAIEEGKSAALLSELRPNVMNMQLGNILPGDTVEVTLRYTELLVPEKGVYEFVYPTVVGPRYMASSSAAEDSFPQLKVGPAGEAPAYDFFLNTHLAAGMPTTFIESPSHPVMVKEEGNFRYRIEQQDAKGGNRDFILRYSLRGKEIQTGLITYEGDDENHFLLVVEPPAKVQLDHCPKREFIFVVDVSGSMSGFPLDISKEIMGKLLDTLSPGEYFNILTFAGGDSTLSETSLLATPENIAKAHTFMNQAAAGGGTNMQPAIEQAMKIPKQRGYSRSFIILTDGEVSYDRSTIEMVATQLDSANFFAFGIGTSVNRFLIEGIAKVGKGLPLFATDPEEGRIKAKTFMEYVAQPVLTDIHVDFGGNKVYDVEPIEQPDLMAERPLVIQGKYKGSLSGEAVISGTSGLGPWEKRIPLGAKPDEGNAALRILWARERIAARSDYSQFQVKSPFEEEITELGMKYNLLTPYTSFVAVLDEVRNPGGLQDSSNVLLPRPMGVSDLADGESIDNIQLAGARNSPIGYSVIRAEISSNSYELAAVSIMATSAYAVAIYDINSVDGFHRTTDFSSSPGTAAMPLAPNPASLFVDGTPLFTGPSVIDLKNIPAWMADLYQYRGKSNPNLPADALPTVAMAYSDLFDGNRGALALSGSQLGELGGEGFLSLSKKHLSTRLDINGSLLSRRMDSNEDGFTDLPTQHQFSAFNFWDIQHVEVDSNLTYSASAALHFADEKRQWSFIDQEIQPWETSHSRRQMAFITEQNLRSSSTDLRLRAMANLTNLDAQYGIREYGGQQQRIWAQLQYNRDLGRYLTFQSHLSYDFDHFDQVWNDTLVPRHERVPAAYVGLRVTTPKRWYATMGMNGQVHNLYGNILSPQANAGYHIILYKLRLEATMMRFTDPANPMVNWRNLLLTTRAVAAPRILRPDQAWVLGGSLQVKPFKGLTIDAQFSHYKYTSRLLPNLDSDPTSVRWLTTPATRRQQLLLAASYTYSNRWSANVSYEWNLDDATIRGRVLKTYFVPAWKLKAGVNYRHDFTREKLTISPYLAWIGPQNIPATLTEVNPLAKAYPLLGLYSSWETKRLFFSLNCENLLNQRQQTVLFGSASPSSLQPLDAGWNWAPMVGPRFTVTVGVKLPSK